jgi:hypothetical protein
MRWHVFQFSAAAVLGSACSNAEALTGALVLPSTTVVSAAVPWPCAALWAKRAGGAALFEEARL